MSSEPERGPEEGEKERVVRFFPFSSVVDTSFWHILANKKLNELKLDETPIPVFAFFRNDQAQGLPPLVSVDYQSFNEEVSDSRNVYPLHGKLMVTNTLEDFKNIDKKQLLDEMGKKMWDNIVSKESLNLAQTLSTFFLLTYGDLKKFKFHYWFAFPALNYPSSRLLSTPRYLKDIWSEDQLTSLEEQHHQLSTEGKPYFLASQHQTTGEITLHSLDDFPQLKLLGGKIFLCFADPSSNNEYPGWPSRNLLALVGIRFRESQWTLICFRLKGTSAKLSLVFDVSLKLESGVTYDQVPSCVGWEKNEKDKLLPRSVDLSHALDPIKLAENAVNLNLKLMRWRLVPTLNLELIADTKCLLLGAGTLGCNVGRGLLAWGIKNITFVDNSKVSFSNPVRQTLFEFKDCLDGGKWKAEAAAEALKRIHPNVNSRGVCLSIPMPGHSVSEKTVETVKQEVLELEALIEQHDCVFLLMDTRESRWLPTVIAQAKKKLVINAALGFDTYLVQRHGVLSLNKAGDCSHKPLDAKNGIIYGSQLGCYFCNDVVAPGDSTKDRTLDQQCTVTRPGVSMIAGALAIELMVSVIQHPLGLDAPAPSVTGCEDPDDNLESCLGIVPHQLRGFLSRFSQLMPTTMAFNCCTGCSPSVVDAYREEGFQFLQKAFNDSSYLEQLSGLKKLHEETNLDDVWALSDSDSECSSIGVKLSTESSL